MIERELPKSWIITDLDTIVSRITNGINAIQYDSPTDNSYPVTRIETIAQETIDLKRVKYVNVKEEDLEKYALKKGDILFSHINSDKHLGKTAFFDLDVVLLHGINLLLIRTLDEYDSKFLNYLFKLYRKEGRFAEVAQRAVNQSSINQKKLRAFPIPLPPLAEQKRIVAKLDAAFGHLETLKTSLNRIPELLKKFRQTALSAAVTGIKNAESNKWPVVKGSDIFEFITSGSRGWADYYSEEGKLFVRITNLSHDTIKIDTSPNKNKFVTPPNGAEGLRTKVRPNDVLISITADVGMIGLVPENFQEAFVNQHVCLARPKSEYFAPYLAYYLASNKGGKEQFNNSKKGATKVGLGLGDIRNLEIPIPPFEEQQEIVKRVETEILPFHWTASE